MSVCTYTDPRMPSCGCESCIESRRRQAEVEAYVKRASAALGGEPPPMPWRIVAALGIELVAVLGFLGWIVWEVAR
ncbi:MAG: hypothetical protein SF182_01560 [Deltaproteobacteria bacterium]|nr:hypothetical protein [Deltaproteobacteria bacterium]